MSDETKTETDTETLVVRDLINMLRCFDPDTEIFGLTRLGAEAIPILSVRNGEVDGGIWVDTACDGVYTGKERKVAQLIIRIE